VSAEPSSGAAGSPSDLRDFWRRFRANRLAVLGLAFMVALVVVAVLAPQIAPYGEAERSSVFRGPPSWDHPFGTDGIGRDVFSRVVLGSRVSLKIGALATAISLIIGVGFGGLAGFFGGWVDGLVMRITDIFLAIPYIVLAVAIASVFGRSQNAIIVVLGLTGWLAIARIVRSSFLSLKELEYVEAARALGFSNSRIMFKHILPNALQPIIVYGTIAVGVTILSEAALSFLGVGPQDPTPAWGLMIADGKGSLSNAPHLVLFPGLAISLTILSLQMIGDGLRDALDPKLR
jgi:ABC-type dipeptide/oligopeptide/nickel transport system permease subunit